MANHLNVIWFDGTAEIVGVMDDAGNCVGIIVPGPASWLGYYRDGTPVAVYPSERVANEALQDRRVEAVAPAVAP